MTHLDLYKRVYLIRRVEESICERYMDDEMKTPVHLSLGQEGISVGVCCALDHEDQMVGTYRSHGIYLARTLETDRLFAELYGRVGGVAKGKTGSMHLSSREHGFLGSSAVVASGIPVAVGAALANRVRGGDQIVAVFFGDGAIDEGVFFESLNFACLKRLKVLFVCEDNDLAIHSRSSERHGYESITDIVRQYHCDVYSSRSTIASEIRALSLKAIERVRTTGRPAFLHLHYYRYREHVGILEDYESGYRVREELEEWLERDPIKLQRVLAIQESNMARVEEVEALVNNQILDSIRRAEQSPFPSSDELLTDVLS